MIKIYLAHPFNSRKYIKKWQRTIENKNIKVINPFYPKRNTECFNEKDTSTENYYKRLNPEVIVSGDLVLIAKSDIVLAVVDGELSYGTIQEIVYGKLMGKKVYIICTNGQERHPWLSYHSDKIFTSFKNVNSFFNKK